jgi:predicted RNase H-like HicB family nuclease
MELMEQRILENVVWKEGKYYVAQCLNIDISSFGESREEALTNLDEAINLYLEDDEHQDIQIVENPEIVHLSVKYA